MWTAGQPSANPKGRPRGSKSNGMALTKAYKERLLRPVSEALKQAHDLDDGATYADAIASNLVNKALGLVPDDKICFVAIKELRETTEGKTPEKAIVAGTNEELIALATIMNGSPAPPDGEETDPEDQSTEDAEERFHES